MAKPWGRIELDHINHDKFRALNANAICLWHEGKNYCDLRHTDGLIPLTTAKQFRFYSKKAAAFLLVSAGRKPGTDVAYAPLWEVIDGFGFKMHDYLEHNPSRERVLEALEEADMKAAERRQQEDESRMVNNERLKRWRDKKQAKRNARETPVETPVKRVAETLRHADETPMKRSSYIDVEVELEKKREERVSLSPPADPFLNQTTTDRAGDFVRRYEVLYPQHRKGARYAIKPARDYAAAVTLCATWEDDARLDKLAIVFLECDNKFAEEGSRTIPQFLALASWCDGKLAEWEATHQVSA